MAPFTLGTTRGSKNSAGAHRGEVHRLSDDIDDIVDRLIDLRMRSGFLQKGVSQFLGVSQSNYCRMESGDIIPTIHHLIKLSRLYKVTLDFIVFGK